MIMDDGGGVAGEAMFLGLLIVVGLFLYILLYPFFEIGSSITNTYSGMGWLSVTGYDTVKGLNLVYASWPFILVGIIILCVVSGGVLARRML